MMSKFAMVSGRLIDIECFNKNDVDLEDIAHHLSKLQRFNGALPLNVTYSVAEHSINLVQHAERIGGFGTLSLRMLLMHDASEAYLSDVVSPVKRQLPEYMILENAIQRIINKKLLNIDVLMDDSEVLKEMDRRIVIDEVQHIKPALEGLYRQESGLDALGCHIHFNNHPGTVRKCFLTLANRLGVAWKR